MTQYKKLLARHGGNRFERVTDSAGKVKRYLVNGEEYVRYAEALRIFRALSNPASCPLGSATPEAGASQESVEADDD